MRSSYPSHSRMHSEKKHVQDLINAGELTNIESLRHYVAQQGWILTRTGVAYVGVKTASGDRFRLFLPGHPKAAAQGRSGPRGREFDFWIYALLAFSGNGNAYYVGQTRNLSRRLREHVKRRDSGVASSALFSWASARNASIGIVLLERVVGTQAQANRAERAWQRRAAMAGYDGLGVCGSTTVSTSGTPDAGWPEGEVRERVQSLLTLIAWLESGRREEVLRAIGVASPRAIVRAAS